MADEGVSLQVDRSNVHLCKRTCEDSTQNKRIKLENETDDDCAHHQHHVQQHHQQQQQQQQQQQLPVSPCNHVRAPVLSGKGDVDLDYFRNYSSIHVHEEMLADSIRTNAYRYAILKNYPHLYKRCVMDVGAGTGILSVFAVQAGARKVYAIEASSMAKQTRLVAKENQMDERIEVIQTRAEEVELPDQVDAIISEWMGYCLLYETMLPSVLRARDKFLRPGGLMFPCKASLYLAPMHDEETIHRLDWWREMKTMYKVSMETMHHAARESLAVDADIRTVPAEAIQAHAVEVCCLDLTSVSPDEVQHIQSPFTFQCFGHNIINGFVTWFTVHFPGGTTLSTSPYLPETHWAQTTFSLRQSFQAEQDTQIKGTFVMKPHPLSHRCLEITLDFAVDDTDHYRQSFGLHNMYPGWPYADDSSAASASPNT